MAKWIHTLFNIVLSVGLLVGYAEIDEVDTRIDNARQECRELVKIQERNLEYHEEEVNTAYEELALKVMAMDLVIRHLVGEEFGYEQQY